MRTCNIICSLLVILSLNTAHAEDLPELATLLSLFSANSTEDGHIRLNWSLDQQSPAVVKFRVYRGYEEIGNFSVLAEIAFHPETGAADYLYQDTSAIPGVTYYYKLAAQGQLNESIFPVVISAAVPLGEKNSGQPDSAPAVILPGQPMRLYMRSGGRVKIERTSPDSRVLIDSQLPAGVFEINSGEIDQTIKIEVPPDYKHSLNWPIR
ncbi:hypothetical protein HUU59_03485 [bacterium]|nr:hypothetical protein [bacterium]